ncbi:MAG: hypothetical protein L0027_03370, partial [Candidatus Rokubacteria bacterium]|nr:hypothetical protein [Candidatus Rokubacteria bacterium]
MTLTRARTALFAAFVLGLGCSITLAQFALGGLILLWLWRLRDPEARARVPRAMLWALAALAAATAVSALASPWPATSLVAGRDVFLGIIVLVTADLLEDARGADRFLSALALVVAGAALVGLIQVLTCPAPEPAAGLGRWFFKRCDRARAFFSIYMTLAGVLLPVLLATAPRVLPGPAFRGWAVAPWLVTLAGLAATYTRGAWLGLGAGAGALLATERRGRLIVSVGLVAVVALALVGPERLASRVRSTVDPADPTIRERFE